MQCHCVETLDVCLLCTAIATDVQLPHLIRVRRWEAVSRSRSYDEKDGASVAMLVPPDYLMARSKTQDKGQKGVGVTCFLLSRAFFRPFKSPQVNMINGNNAVKGFRITAVGCNKRFNLTTVNVPVQLTVHITTLATHTLATTKCGKWAKLTHNENYGKVNHTTTAAGRQ